MGFQTLTISHPQPGIGVVTLRRPEAANALNTKLAEELLECFRQINASGGKERVIVLTGEGTRAFCAGADLKDRREMTDDAWQQQHAIFEAVIREIVACALPVIAAVNGAAYGGGCELALACDVIYASQDARFALPEATLGIMPGMGGTQTLARAVGERRAKEIILSGRPFSAEQAQEWGMVNHVSYNDQLMNDALDLAGHIARNAPLSVRAIKKAIAEGTGQALPEALETELRHYRTLVPTRDRHEGTAAFHEKRPPVFSGE